MKRMIIASTSTIHGSGYLEYLAPRLETFFETVSEVLFIPYSRPNGLSHDAYTEIVAKTLSKIGLSVKGLHEYENVKEAVKNAQAIFTGGGNTFVLVKMLQDLDLMVDLQYVINAGTPYLGTSAGSNITGLTMKTTNDMPIVQPKSFDTLGVLPININPHYLDPDPQSTHKGETRETRIAEFHTYNDTPVIGLREGSWLEVLDNEIILKGNLMARWFEAGKLPVEIESDTKINNLIN